MDVCDLTVCKLIDLVLSSSIEDTVRRVDETDALRTLVFSTGPPIAKAQIPNNRKRLTNASPLPPAPWAVCLA